MPFSATPQKPECTPAITFASGPPCVGIRHNSGFPSVVHGFLKAPTGSRTTYNQLPSGDHRGEPTSGPRKKVNWRGFSSLPQTQISKLPERLEANAMVDPSGEKLGS